MLESIAISSGPLGQCPVVSLRGLKRWSPVGLTLNARPGNRSLRTSGARPIRRRSAVTATWAVGTELLRNVGENAIVYGLVVIFAGYKDRMDDFFRSNPGLSSRVAHHIDFPDYSDDELYRIAEIMLAKQSYRLSPAGQEALKTYIAARKRQPLRPSRVQLHLLQTSRKRRKRGSSRNCLERAETTTSNSRRIRPSRIRVIVGYYGVRPL